MPRKDRRFTGYDIARLYCKNLTPAQRARAGVLMEYCEQYEDDDDLVVALLYYISDIVSNTHLYGAEFVALALDALAIACDQDFTPEQIYDYLDFELMTGGFGGS